MWVNIFFKNKDVWHVAGGHKSRGAVGGTAFLMLAARPIFW